MADLISLSETKLLVCMTLLLVFSTRIFAGQLNSVLDHPLPAETIPKIHGTSFARPGRQGNFIRIGRHILRRQDDLPMDNLLSADASVKNHVTSFARFGRQGNFVRIGRRVLGRLDDKKLHQADEYITKEQLPRLIRNMQWYPHYSFHRFIRVGQDSAHDDVQGQQNNIDGMQFPRYINPAAKKMKIHDQAKKTSSFVRIGRSGMSKLHLSNDDSLKARIKQKMIDDSMNEYGYGLEDNYSHKRNNRNKKYTDFVYFRKPSTLQSRKYGSNRRNNKIRKTYFLDNDFDYGKIDGKLPGFVKKSKNDYKEANNRVINNNSIRPWDFKKLGARNMIQEKDIDGDRDKNNNLKNVSFGRATDSNEAKNVYEDNQNSYILYEGTTAKGIDHDVESSSSNFVQAPQRASPNDPPIFLQTKRASPVFQISPASAQNDLPYPDGPMDAANRRSAFVRIGKIPSSAFVRIGKNFDRVFQLPVAKDNFYNHRLRKGRSSFVRIG